MSPRVGWLVGRRGTILRTMDGGASWDLQQSPVAWTLEQAHFADASEGWIVGQCGTILHTTTGGRRWYRQDSGSQETLYDVTFWDTEEGWAVGRAGLARLEGDRWIPHEAGLCGGPLAFEENGTIWLGVGSSLFHLHP